MLTSILLDTLANQKDKPVCSYMPNLSKTWETLWIFKTKVWKKNKEKGTQIKHALNKTVDYSNKKGETKMAKSTENET